MFTLWQDFEALRIRERKTFTLALRRLYKNQNGVLRPKGPHGSRAVPEPSIWFKVCVETLARRDATTKRQHLGWTHSTVSRILRRSERDDALQLDDDQEWLSITRFARDGAHCERPLFPSFRDGKNRRT